MAPRGHRTFLGDERHNGDFPIKVSFGFGLFSHVQMESIEFPQMFPLNSAIENICHQKGSNLQPPV